MLNQRLRRGISVSAILFVGGLAACTYTTTTIVPGPGPGDASTTGDANLGSDGKTTERDGSTTTDGSTIRDGSTVRDGSTTRDGGVRSDASVSCYDDTNAKTFSTAPPQAGQNVCNTTALNSFFSACMGAGSSAAACDAFIAANKACTRCILGPQTGDTPSSVPQPVLISVGDSVYLNVGACEQLAVGAPTTCATKAGNEALCLLSTCETCDTADRSACIADSAGSDPCLSALAGATCEAYVTANQATADLKCGATAGATFEDIYRKAGAFMCGAP
jgi:hypothetical protein